MQSIDDLLRDLIVCVAPVSLCVVAPHTIVCVVQEPSSSTSISTSAIRDQPSAVWPIYRNAIFQLILFFFSF